MAGGFINETQIFKAIALSNFGDGPIVKGVLMGRSPLTAVMKASYFVELAQQGKLPKSFAEKFGDTPEKFFVAAPDLKAKYGERFKEIPWEAVGLYTYLHERIRVGLMQLMAGARKWRLDLLDRSDLMALTERAARVTGIPLAEEADADQIESILDF